MSSLFNNIGAVSFQEPQNDDTTSAPPEPQAPTVPAGQFAGSELAQFLKSKTKQKKPKQNSSVLAAIRRSKSGRPSSSKWG